MFWDTIPGLIATYAAAIIGIGVIFKAAWKATRWGRRLVQGADRIIDIGNTTDWPNGSTTLPESLTEIYGRQMEILQMVTDADRRVSEVGLKLDSYIVAHRADHGLTPPEPEFG